LKRNFLQSVYFCFKKMRIGFFPILILLAFRLSAQSDPQNKGTGVLFHFGLGGQLPGADLTTRFGSNLNFGSGLEVLTATQNLIFGLEGYYLFGSTIKENPLARISTAEGFVIGSDGGYADVQLRQRGFYLGGLVGKLFSCSAKNPRSGIRVTVGVGLLQHQIRIQEDPLRFVPQLAGAYQKGYDRLSNGLAFNEFIGYQRLSTNKRINFYLGLEFTQGFTRNRRAFNFDTQSADTQKRFDLLVGVRAGWTLPFYGGKQAAEIYY